MGSSPAGTPTAAGSSPDGTSVAAGTAALGSATSSGTGAATATGAGGFGAKRCGSDAWPGPPGVLGDAAWTGVAAAGTSAASGLHGPRSAVLAAWVTPTAASATVASAAASQPLRASAEARLGTRVEIPTASRSRTSLDSRASHANNVRTSATTAAAPAVHTTSGRPSGAGSDGVPRWTANAGTARPTAWRVWARTSSSSQDTFDHSTTQAPADSICREMTARPLEVLPSEAARRAVIPAAARYPASWPA